MAESKKDVKKEEGSKKEPAKNSQNMFGPKKVIKESKNKR